MAGWNLPFADTTAETADNESLPLRALPTAGVLADFIRHHNGFVAVLFQFRHSAGQFLVGNVQGAVDMSGFKLGGTSYVDYQPGHCSSGEPVRWCRDLPPFAVRDDKDCN